MPEFQAVMARLLERCILPGHSVDPNNLCISSGKRQLPATACHCLPLPATSCLPHCLPLPSRRAALPPAGSCLAGLCSLRHAWPAQRA